MANHIPPLEKQKEINREWDLGGAEDACVTSCTRLHNYVACVEVFDPSYSLWASIIFVMKFEVIVHFIGTAFPIELFRCMFHFIFLSKSFAKCKQLVQEIGSYFPSLNSVWYLQWEFQLMVTF